MVALHFWILDSGKIAKKQSKKYVVVEKQEKVANYFREKSKDFS